MPKIRNLKLFYFLLIGLWGIFISCQAPIHAEESFPIKALWVTQKQLSSSQNVRKIIKTALEWQMTDLFVQVRARGNAAYLSNLEPLDEAIQFPYDPLEDIIFQAHAEGLKVHAWINAYYIWSDQKYPKDPNHVFYRFKPWILKLGGSYFLNPSRPEVQAHTQQVIQDIALRYSIDGIHLDYFRYPYEVSRSDWQTMRRRHLNQFLKKLWEWKNNFKPRLKLSAAVIADFDKAYSRYSQDWETWMKNRWLDYVLPMAYHKNRETFKQYVRRANQFAKQASVPVIIGVGVWQLDSAQFKDQLYLLQNIKQLEQFPFLKGICLFSYGHLKPYHRKVWEQFLLKKNN